MQVMRCGNVSDAVSHSTQALVTDAATATATAPPIRQLSLLNSSKCISGATTRVKKKNHRGSGSPGQSHFYTQFALLTSMGKKKTAII